ncbi:MAG: hypothetical protein MK108_06405 [Mariniblastus sp.]|nr:hypothetical protein [Mariniblastus sp.]
MSESFDPYLKWLGIRDPERPPNHYRLLGLDLYESDPEVIDGAADRQMSHVRTFQTGPNADISQSLLNELAVARRCLLDDERRAEYDQQLRAGPINETGSPADRPVVAAKIIGGSSRRSWAGKSRPFWFDLVGWAGGGLTAVVVAYFLISSNWLSGGSQQASLPVADDAPTTGAVDQADGRPEGNGEARQTPPEESPATEPQASGAAPPPDRAVEEPAKEPTEKPSDQRPENPSASATDNPPDKGPDTAPMDAQKQMQTPVAPAAIAPWEADDRLPELPSFISEPASAADRRFQPIYVGLAKRKYDLVKQFYPKVAPFADELSQPIEVESVLEQMATFWQLVGRAASGLQAGDSLAFNDRSVKVTAVSDRSLELEWSPEAGDDQPPVIQRFTTDAASMDRDLAIALARHESPDSTELIDLFQQYDYFHADLTVPPELLVGTGVVLNGGGSKSALPDKESVRDARKTILELYESDFASGRFLQQQALAHKLLGDALAAQTDAMQYALLDEAGQLGVRIGDGEVVFAALSEIDNDFEVEFWEPLIDQMKAAQKNANTPLQYGTITSGLFEAVNRAVQQEQLDTALQFSADGIKAAKKLGVENQLRMFEDYQKQLREMVEWYEVGVEALQELKQDPDNSKDHFSAARWLCFVKNDWDQGLASLARCGSSKLERLAKQDQEMSAGQAGADQLEELFSLADGWYEAGQNNKGTMARALLVRAHHWYSIAKDSASGLDRQKALRRQIELQPWLAFFDAYRDDEVFVQSQEWRFGTRDKVVFQTASFRGSLFEYELPVVGSSRRTRRRNANLSKTGDTYQIEPADTNSRVYLRLMRDRRIELLQYSLENGQLLADGWGEVIDP